MTFSTMQVVFRNKKRNAYKAKLYCSQYGFYQSGSFRSDYETNQFKTKNDFANAIERYLNNPNAYMECLEVDNDQYKFTGETQLVLLNTLLDELKG